MEARPINPPTRVQLSRKKGFRLPPNTVTVSRPSRYGNPFNVTPDRTQAMAVTAFEMWLTGNFTGLEKEKLFILSTLHELKGKNLACWCKPGTPCHADVLLRMANQ